VLVLGSMPSVASLAAGEYYAHPRNVFWPIAAELFGFDARAPYAKRRAALRAADIALWDVVASCRRPGSLDAAIVERSIRANDFAAFLRRHPRITRVCFNGRRAADAWRRHVAPQLPPARKLDYRLLPSTSPANAGMGYLRKLAHWRDGLGC
jgi:hypoxanthine-DNA glycosylase